MLSKLAFWLTYSSVGALALSTPAITAPRALAQTSEPEIAAKLQGKPLILRGFWNANYLNFDEAGNPTKPFHTAPFTESGVTITRVKLKKDALVLQGQRVGFEFDDQGQFHRVPLQWTNFEGTIDIEILGKPGTDFGPALDRIFAPDLASITPSLPSYWRDYATAHFLPASSTAQTAPVSKPLPQGVFHVGNSVQPPRLTKNVDPVFSDVARALRYSATVEVYLWVDAQGIPTHLGISKAAGMGLDEQALAGVARYRFAPATRNGSPVAVDLYVDVNFQIQ